MKLRVVKVGQLVAVFDDEDRFVALAFYPDLHLPTAHSEIMFAERPTHQKALMEARKMRHMTREWQVLVKKAAEGHALHESLFTKPNAAARPRRRRNSRI